MIECPSCGARHIENSLFCAECGEELAVKGKRVSGSEGRSVDIRFILDGEEPERSLQVRLTAESMIGRLDTGNDVFPDIDLGEWGGAEAGVSRSHAVLRLYGDEVQLEDLGSTNGTLVNGKRLTPYVGQPLRDGDRLILGSLSMMVNILSVSGSSINDGG